MHKILLLLNRHRGLFVFTALNYIDKLLLFGLPLFVLFISGDKQTYNNIEYVFSIANILIIFLDFLTMYSFYGYRQSEDRDNFPIRIQKYFYIFFILYSLIGLLLYPVIYCIIENESLKLLYFYICIRTLYLLIINFYKNYFRLIDKPSGVYVISILISLSSFMAIYIVYRLKFDLINGFFLIPTILNIVVLLVSFCKVRRSAFQGLKACLQSAIKYTIPLIINSFFGAVINNYGKLYAYNFLSQSEMYQFAYTLRLSAIIQMAHVSVLGFHSKSIFIDKARGINIKIFLINIM
jgi:hypothetical protein